MLVKLLPENIAKYWDTIRLAMESSIPQDYLRTHDRMNNILDNLLCDEMQAWFSVDDKREEITEYPPVVALLITVIFGDPVTRVRSLCLYCLYAFDEIPIYAWDDAWDTLLKYAKGKECRQVEAYVSNPTFVKMAKAAGWNTDSTYIYRDI